MNNHFLKYLLIFFLVFSSSLIITSCGEDELEEEITGNHNMGQQNDNNNWDLQCTCLNENFAIEELSNDEKEALQYMREEEKMAHDVYTYFYEKWDHHVFSNISNSESQHMSIVLCLQEKYGLEDIVGDNDQGVFINEHLAELYATLTDAGDVSLTEAFRVGATIEDLDIYDLEIFIETKINNEDIYIAFQELVKGSRNHMRAFTKNLGKLDAAYTPQYISQEDYDAIINSYKETNEIICSN